MPADVPAVPGTMRIHQVVTLAPGEITSRDISCMCSTYTKQLQCECWNTHHFSFIKKVPPAVSQGQTQINRFDPEVLGQCCVLMYDNALHPGVILQTDETDFLAKCMHHSGLCKKQFFWHKHDDVLLYPSDNVLKLIPPPQPVTARDSRHLQIQTEVWNSLSGL